MAKKNYDFDDLDEFEEEKPAKKEEPKKTAAAPPVVVETEDDFSDEEGDNEDDGFDDAEEVEDGFDGDDDGEDVSSLLQKEKNKAKGKGKNNSGKVIPPPKKEYEGPRLVKAYGEELFTITDPKVTNEEIRQRVVNDYHYAEFSKDRAVFSLDETTGILVIDCKFEKKG